MKDAARTWPVRRWLAAIAALPAMIALFALTGRTGGQDGTPWWTWPWLALISVLAATALASYLAPPGTRKLIDAGCSPCAAVAGLAVAGAVMAHASAPGSPFMATVAVALTAFALRRRLADARACQTPVAAAPPAVPVATPNLGPQGQPDDPGAPDGPGRPITSARPLTAIGFDDNDTAPPRAVGLNLDTGESGRC